MCFRHFLLHPSSYLLYILRTWKWPLWKWLSSSKPPFFFGGGPSSSSRFSTPKKHVYDPFTTPFPDRPTDCTFIAYIMHNSPGLGLQISGELIFIGNLRVYLVRHRMGWVVFFRELEGKSQERIGCPKCVYDIHHMCRFVMSTSKTQQPKHIGALCKHVH